MSKDFFHEKEIKFCREMAEFHEDHAAYMQGLVGQLEQYGLDATKETANMMYHLHRAHKWWMAYRDWCELKRLASLI